MAFTVLSTARPQGLAPGGIPIRDMESYARMHGVEDVEKFVRVMHALDVTFLNDVRERAEAEAANRPK